MKIHEILIDNIAQALIEIFNQSKFADKVIERYLKGHPKWGSRDRRFFAESVYDLVRHFRRLKFLASMGDEQELTEIDFKKIWFIYAFERGLIPDLKPYGMDSIRYQNQKNKLEKTSPAVQGSWPDWLYEKGQKELGQEAWKTLSVKLNEQAPVDIRINTLLPESKDIVTLLNQEGIQLLPIKYVSEGFELRERKNVFITQSFKKGLFEVQDRSSQQIARILNPQPGERVGDACAGAGGKSLHMGALMNNQGRLLALDIHSWKLDELKKRARRAKLSIIEPRVIENSKTIKRLHQSFDKLLLDVPCSGSGVIRRNPDTKWKLSPERLEQLRKDQFNILTQYSLMVKPGGVMVYSTCSIFPSENEEQIQAFLAQDQDKKWSLTREWHCYLDKNCGDGFYAAKLQRSAD